METFFTSLGKAIVTLFVIALLAGGGYYLYNNYFRSNNNAIINQAVSPTLTQAVISPMTTQPIVSSPTVSNGKKVSSGTKTAFFNPYTVTVSTGWTDTQTTNTASNTLTLTKGTNKIVISQGPGGAGSCNYPGETPEPMAQVFTSFVGITNEQFQFRRGTSDNLNYTVCENKSGGFAFPTSVGYITIQSDSSSLPEVDAMLASLTK